eukprot:TRINITY_DN3922_c0_g1_i1.p1 TRINITY_DN3922_c0_g1~~TRINITY_DN3922_c0_g1_i1.p1  ORF type:complete len:526 (-),score=118.52 TRINITY_DN3922_c0_g1_i1:1033-2610(-)
MEFLSRWVSGSRSSGGVTSPSKESVETSSSRSSFTETTDTSSSSQDKPAKIHHPLEDLFEDGTATSDQEVLPQDLQSLSLNRSPSSNQPRDGLYSSLESIFDLTNPKQLQKSPSQNAGLWKGKRARGAYLDALKTLNESSALIQSVVRMRIQRKKFQKMRKAAILLQACARVPLSKLQLAHRRRMLKQRSNVLNEIVATERTYTECLEICCEILITPLLKNNLISQEEAAQIFSNLDYKIVKIHIQLLKNLERRMEEWNASGDQTKEQRVGDIFLDLVEEFKSYRHYITNYNESLQMLNACIAKSPAFNQFLLEAKSNPRCNLRGASDFLIMPIQRLPRYELLLSDLLKCTDEHHSDYSDIKECLSQLKQITNYLNELKRQADSTSRMLVVEKKVIGNTKPSSIFQEGRMLIREGPLVHLKQMGPGKESELYVFLFSDIIMASKMTAIRKGLIERTMRYNHEITIPLKGTVVDDMKPEEVRGVPAENLFKLVTNDGKLLVFKATNVYQKNNWMNDIKQAILALTP